MSTIFRDKLQNICNIADMFFVLYVFNLVDSLCCTSCMLIKNRLNCKKTIIISGNFIISHRISNFLPKKWIISCWKWMWWVVFRFNIRNHLFFLSILFSKEKFSLKTKVLNYGTITKKNDNIQGGHIIMWKHNFSVFSSSEKLLF